MTVWFNRFPSTGLYFGFMIFGQEVSKYRSILWFYDLWPRFKWSSTANDRAIIGRGSEYVLGCQCSRLELHDTPTVNWLFNTCTTFGRACLYVMPKVHQKDEEKGCIPDQSPLPSTNNSHLILLLLATRQPTLTHHVTPTKFRTRLITKKGSGRSLISQIGHDGLVCLNVV